MDKFVIKAPTWKTMSYQNLSASKGRSSLGGKLITTNTPNGMKMVLKENQSIANVKLNNNANRRLSILDEKLLQLMSMPADEPLTPSGNNNKESFYNLTPKSGRKESKYGDENERSTPTSRTSTQFIYLTPQSKASDYLAQTETSRISVSETTNEDNVAYEKLLYGSEHKVKSPLKLQRIKSNTNDANIINDRIQADLNSPAASVRVRAIKALKDPQSYAAYTKLDVPHEEQSIITAEDRRTPPPAPTIQDVMKNVVAYVEVRYGEDNRTAGIKKHMEALGARVNNNLLRNTTIVIFNEGLLSTYKKAKSLNIPIVSILWVDACESELRLCDPKNYPISNADRYENPELYEKFKRVKCIHPDSELTLRIRPKPGTPKDSTPKRAATPKSKSKITSAKGKAKTDISQYFKPLGKNSDSQNREDAPAFITPSGKPRNNRNEVNIGSTPISSLSNELNNIDLNQKEPASNPKEEKKNKKKGEENPLINKTDQEKGAQGDDNPSRIGAGLDNTPGTRYLTRRRSSMLLSDQKTSPSKSSNTITTPKSTRKRQQHQNDEIPTITEEDLTIIANNMSVYNSNPSPNKKTKSRRRTTYTGRSLDMSDVPPKDDKTITPSVQKIVFPLNRNRRRTLFTSQKMEITLTDLDAEEEFSKNKTKPEKKLSPTISNADKTWTNLASSTMINNNNTPKALEGFDKSKTLLEEQSETLVFSSTREPKASKTLFEVGMDIINQRMVNINRSARRSINPCSGDDKLLPPTRVEETEISKAKALTNCTDQVDNKETSSAPVNGIKKRKLFMPNESVTQDLTPAQSISNTLTASNKRRKSIMPPSVKKTNEDKTTVPLESVEDNNNDNNEKAKDEKLTKEIKTTNHGCAGDSTTNDEKLDKIQPEESNNTNLSHTSKCRTARRSTLLFEKTEKIFKSQQRAKKALAKDTRKVLVYTNMHVEQINAIREALTYMGGFRLDYVVNNSTTHLVSLEPRRTLNMLRALIRGVWILDFRWVVDSHKAGKWQPEEPYEMNSFSRAVEICRTEKQAFKEYYQCDLFRDLDAFYVSTESGPLSKQNLKELIKSCGGQVHEHRSAAKYIIATKHKGGGHIDSVYVTPFWILDSITHMQLLPYQKYTLPRYNVQSKHTKAYIADSPYKSHNDVMKALQLPHIL